MADERVLEHRTEIGVSRYGFRLSWIAEGPLGATEFHVDLPMPDPARGCCAGLDAHGRLPRSHAIHNDFCSALGGQPCWQDGSFLAATRLFNEKVREAGGDATNAIFSELDQHYEEWLARGAEDREAEAD